MAGCSGAAGEYAGGVRARVRQWHFPLPDPPPQDGGGGSYSLPPCLWMGDRPLLPPRLRTSARPLLPHAYGRVIALSFPHFVGEGRDGGTNGANLNNTPTSIRFIPQNRRPMHHPPLRQVIRIGVMLRHTVIPNRHITLLPAPAHLKLRLRDMGEQKAQ